MAITATQVANMALRHLGAPQSIVDIATDGTKEANLCKDAIDNIRKAFIRSYPWKWAKTRDTIGAIEMADGYDDTGLCAITTVAAHGLSTGAWVAIADVQKQGWNGRWQITVTSPTDFTLNGSTFVEVITKPTDAGVWGESQAFGPLFKFAKPSGFIRMLREDNNEEYAIEGQYICTDASSLDIFFLKDITAYENFDPMALEGLAILLAWSIAYALTQSQKVEAAQWEKYVQFLKKTRHVDSTEDPTRNLYDPSWTDVRITGAWVRDPLT